METIAKLILYPAAAVSGLLLLMEALNMVVVLVRRKGKASVSVMNLALFVVIIYLISLT
jgi:hypothetical protein